MHRARKPQIENLVVLGGHGLPGVGKAHFVKQLIMELQVEETGGSLESVAFTGVAACNTPRSIFQQATSQGCPLSMKQAFVLKTNMQNCSFLLMDEISMGALLCQG